MTVEHVESRVFSVTVYSESAHVTRRAKITLPPGVHRLAIDRLPSFVDPSDTRVRARSGRVRAVEWDRVPAKKIELSDAAALDEAISLLRAKVEHLGAEMGALELEVALIDAVQPVPTANGAPQLRPDIFLQGLEVVRKRRSETVYELRKKQYERSCAEDELRELAERRARSGKTSDDGGVATVFVVTLETSGGDVLVDVTYDAEWATWRPYYHLRIDPVLRIIECARFADVWQETGEDWNQTQLSISTAQPERGLRLPQVTPWVLGLAKAYDDELAALYRREELARRSVVPVDFDDRDESDELTAYKEQFDEEGIFASKTCAGVVKLRRADGSTFVPTTPESVDAFMQEERPRFAKPRAGPRATHPDRQLFRSLDPPESSSGGIDFVLQVAGETSALSGVERTRFSLGSASYPARVEYVLRPALREHAYGRAVVTNGEDVPLLAGPAAIFVEDSYFGDTTLETTPARGKWVLELGAETGVRAVRRAKTVVRTEGLIAREDVHAVEVTIEIQNYTGGLVEIAVEDQIPISRDAKVFVRLTHTDPKDMKYDELSGLVRMRIALDAGAKRAVSFVYEITVPKDYGIEQVLA
jgi:hypothetical protein